MACRAALKCDGPARAFLRLSRQPTTRSKREAHRHAGFPYVRRTAISLRLLGIDFDHLPLSVFSTFDEFRAINPVVKAPTLVLDDGTVLMDSTLIIDYAEHASGRTLMPDSLEQRRQATAVIGLALAA